jgi:DNA-directed RNA polymerase sigma subunit (sigma70/sigma32)
MSVAIPPRTYNFPNLKPLKQETVNELVEKWQQEGDIDARNTVIEHNGKFAIKTACLFRKKYYHIPIDDLCGYAVEGLFKAIDTFDTKRGFKFTTHAQYWIWAKINEGALKNECLVRAPVNQLNSAFKGKLTEESIALLMSNMRGSLSLDKPMGDTEGTLLDTLDDPNSLLSDDLTLVEKLGRVIDPTEVKILNQMFGIDREKETDASIAASMNMPKKAFRTLKKSIFSKLRSSLALKSMITGNLSEEEDLDEIQSPCRLSKAMTEKQKRFFYGTPTNIKKAPTIDLRARPEDKFGVFSCIQCNFIEALGLQVKTSSGRRRKSSRLP